MTAGPPRACWRCCRAQTLLFISGTRCPARRFTALLQALLDSNYSPVCLRGAAADCLAELLNKRMEPTAKLSLIKVRCCTARARDPGVQVQLSVGVHVLP